MCSRAYCFPRLLICFKVKLAQEKARFRSTFCVDVQLSRLAFRLSGVRACSAKNNLNLS